METEGQLAPAGRKAGPQQSVQHGRAGVSFAMRDPEQRNMGSRLVGCARGETRDPGVAFHQRLRSGAVKRTSKAGSGELGDRGHALALSRSGQQPIRRAADEDVARVELLLRDPFVRLMGLGNMAGAADDRRDAGVLVVATLGAVAYFAGAVRTP